MPAPSKEIHLMRQDCFDHYGQKHNTVAMAAN